MGSGGAGRAGAGRGGGGGGHRQHPLLQLRSGVAWSGGVGEWGRRHESEAIGRRQGQGDDDND